MPKVKWFYEPCMCRRPRRVKFTVTPYRGGGKDRVFMTCGACSPAVGYALAVLGHGYWTESYKPKRFKKQPHGEGV